MPDSENGISSCGHNRLWCEPQEWELEPEDALLSVTTGELITNDGIALEELIQ
jgi:hypothetical protein